MFFRKYNPKKDTYSMYQETEVLKVERTKKIIIANKSHQTSDLKKQIVIKNNCSEYDNTFQLPNNLKDENTIISEIGEGDSLEQFCIIKAYFSGEFIRLVNPELAPKSSFCYTPRENYN